MNFTETNWESISGKIAETFRLDEEELQRLQRNHVAKLVAAIPFAAGCEDSERTALAHLGIYMMARDQACKDSFGHNPEDNADIFRRISLLDSFSGGNKTVIDKGMNLLALCQLEDHKHDLAEDQAAGKYNPIAAGAWDYENIKKNLVEEIQSAESTELDAVMTVDSVRGFWNDG